MSNIFFTTLHYRTPFIHALSEELKSRGHDIYFLCPSPKWRMWLLDKGIKNKQIIDQSLSINFLPLSNMEEKYFDEISALEKKGNLTINSMILMDQILSEWPKCEAFNYLIRLYILLKESFSNVKPDIVIGEATPANELLISSICNSFNIPYCCPSTVRIPDNRFAFFKGRLQCDFLNKKEVTQQEQNIAKLWAEKYISEYKAVKPKPSYWSLNNKIPKFKLFWFLRFFTSIIEDLKYKKSDPTRFNSKWLFKKRMQEIWNKYQLKRVRFYDFIEENAKDESFILFPLHKQPESSIDVLGDFYSDQLNLIKQIAKCIPVTHKLFVKEHSNAIGDRTLSFYREILRLPNVEIISPYCDSFTLIKNASVIVTVSGTMAYEAGLLDYPAITFSKMFFSCLPSVRYCSAIRELPLILDELIHYHKCDLNDANKIKFLADLYLNSFDGVFSDVKSYPEIMDVENIKKVCSAIELVI